MMNKSLVLLFSGGILFLSCVQKNNPEVKPEPISPTKVAVTSVTINRTSAEIVEGETAQLTATVLPSNATEKAVVWSSSNQAIAAVSGSGLVTALSKGNATITASADGKSASCSVTVLVKMVAVTEVSLNKTSLLLILGMSDTLSAVVLPADATDKTIVWSSSDETVATIDQEGRVSAKGIGNAVINAKAGSINATCSVTVTDVVSGGHEGTGSEIWD